VALSGAAEVVRAGGGVVRRAGPGGEEVLLVHRPRYDDWSFPKGKADSGEADEQAALREVEEETGYACDLGQELPSTRYQDARGRPKVVRYWTMRVESGEFEPHDEVDEIRWLRRRDALELLTYDRDREVLSAVPPPILVIRHATAGQRRNWDGDDALRPLDPRGIRQSAAFVEQLAPFELERIVSSPFVRCVQSVEPLAAARGLEVELVDQLAEGVDGKQVRSLLAGLNGTAAAACGHGPEIHPLFGKTKKGATVIVEAANGAFGELGRLPPPG
jgi:8-oxo-dGTP pyrophosphatase MutT (NUDIX family)/phosphohistidine phosphatase SixA